MGDTRPSNCLTELQNSNFAAYVRSLGANDEIVEKSEVFVPAFELANRSSLDQNLNMASSSVRS